MGDCPQLPVLLTHLKPGWTGNLKRKLHSLQISNFKEFYWSSKEQNKKLTVFTFAPKTIQKQWCSLLVSSNSCDSHKIHWWGLVFRKDLIFPAEHTADISHPHSFPLSVPLIALKLSENFVNNQLYKSFAHCLPKSSVLMRKWLLMRTCSFLASDSKRHRS